jgi:hypothetical protein
MTKEQIQAQSIGRELARVLVRVNEFKGNRNNILDQAFLFAIWFNKREQISDALDAIAETWNVIVDPSETK